MAIAASTLMAEAACYCGAQASNAQLLKLALYRRWLLAVSPGADVSAEALMETAKCYCGVSGSTAERMEMAFLSKIAEATA
jgi:hypothetical protein